MGVYQITNGEVVVKLTNIGCSVMSIHVAGVNIVAGFDNPEDYLVNPDYLGCVVGRYANRIAGGQFTLDGVLYQLPGNNGANHLHGSFHKKIWEVVAFNDARIAFKYVSPDGEDGYPGTVTVLVTYTVHENKLIIEYQADTDKATPINLTNHTYFNLNGTKTIHDHLLQVNATSYTEKNEANVPTGKILPVAETALDFSSLTRLGDRLNDFPLDHGYDHNFVLDGEFGARLYEPVSGRAVNVFTTQPGLQIYTANHWKQQHGAVALETQSFPDSPNHPHFPDTILRPGKPYYSKTIYEFTTHNL